MCVSIYLKKKSCFNLNRKYFPCRISIFSLAFFLNEHDDGIKVNSELKNFYRNRTIYLPINTASTLQNEWLLSSPVDYVKNNSANISTMDRHNTEKLLLKYKGWFWTSTKFNLTPIIIPADSIRFHHHHFHKIFRDSNSIGLSRSFVCSSSSI